MSLSYERHCDEIVAQTELVRSHIEGADLTTPVPSCPDWNLRQLLRHLGGAHRWTEETIRTRSTEFIPDDHFRDLSSYTDTDPAVLGEWLAEGAAQLAETLRKAGPGTEAWTPLPGIPASDFFARRMANETVIHRADAVLAVGTEFTVDEDVAVDAFDEWLYLGSLPQMFEYHPEMRELLGPGRTLHFHATGTTPEKNAEWVVDLTGDAISWRRAHEKSAVAVRGPLTDLLLLIYRRRSPDSEGIEVLGDRQLLDFWLERVSFG